MALETLLTIPAPEGLDLAHLYAHLRPFGVTGQEGAALFLFVEDGEIRIKAEMETEAPEGLADALAAYVPPPPPPPPAPYVPTYADLRAAAYALEVGPLEQQLDALFKSLTFPAGSEAAAIQAKRNAIKAEYPKPTT